MCQKKVEERPDDFFDFLFYLSLLLLTHLSKRYLRPKVLLVFLLSVIFLAEAEA